MLIVTHLYSVKVKFSDGKLGQVSVWADEDGLRHSISEEEYLYTEIELQLRKWMPSKAITWELIDSEIVTTVDYSEKEE